MLMPSFHSRRSLGRRSSIRLYYVQTTLLAFLFYNMSESCWRLSHHFEAAWVCEWLDASWNSGQRTIRARHSKTMQNNIEKLLTLGPFGGFGTSEFGFGLLGRTDCFGCFGCFGMFFLACFAFCVFLFVRWVEFRNSRIYCLCVRETDSYM